MAAFAPRNARHSIYLAPIFPEKKNLWACLGKHKETLSCVYINKLTDVDLAVLRELILASLEEIMRKNDLSKQK